MQVCGSLQFRYDTLQATGSTFPSKAVKNHTDHIFFSNLERTVVSKANLVVLSYWFLVFSFLTKVSLCNFMKYLKKNPKKGKNSHFSTAIPIFCLIFCDISSNSHIFIFPIFLKIDFLYGHTECGYFYFYRWKKSILV